MNNQTPTVEESIASALNVHAHVCALMCACVRACVCVNPYLYQVPHLTLQKSLELLVTKVLDHNKLKLLCIARDNLAHLQPRWVLTQQFHHVHGQQGSGVEGDGSCRAFTSDLAREESIKARWRREVKRERGERVERGMEGRWEVERGVREWREGWRREGRGWKVK